MGIWKLLLLLAVVLVVFGPGKLPDALKDLGKGLKSLKDELQDEKKDKEAVAMTDVTPGKEESKRDI